MATMTAHTVPPFLTLPPRPVKPRATGVTIMIDNGLPTRAFADLVESGCEFVDIVKFGWGTSLVTRHLNEKIRVLKLLGIEYFFGGSLFEKSLVQNKLSDFLGFCDLHGCSFVEVSNGTIDLEDGLKSEYVARVAKDFRVISEVGSKDEETSEKMAPFQWVNCINADIDAGAYLVTLETRESGRGGICRANGELRHELVEEILTSGIDARMLVFEAPTTQLQNHFVRRVGHNVNLANIASTDLIGLETIRLGLRSETLLEFEYPATTLTRLSA
jgi:phosphosulfolactate synthase